MGNMCMWHLVPRPLAVIRTHRGVGVAGCAWLSGPLHWQWPTGWWGECLELFVLAMVWQLYSQEAEDNKQCSVAGPFMAATPEVTRATGSTCSWDPQWCEATLISGVWNVWVVFSCSYSLCKRFLATREPKHARRKKFQWKYHPALISLSPAKVPCFSGRPMSPPTLPHPFKLFSHSQP